MCIYISMMRICRHYTCTSMYIHTLGALLSCCVFCVCSVFVICAFTCRRSASCIAYVSGFPSLAQARILPLACILTQGTILCTLHFSALQRIQYNSSCAM